MVARVSEADFPGRIARDRSWPRIAVGMPITEPPRTDPGVPNSGTGLLPRVFDGEALIRPRMKDSRGRKPGIGDSSHLLPRHGVLPDAQAWARLD